MKSVALGIVCLLAITACTTTVSTSGIGTAYTVARVQELAVLQTMTADEADAFRQENESIAEVALGEELFDAYWSDEFQADYAILRKQRRGFELLKVQRIGTANVEKFEGERNGKPFSTLRVW